MFLYVCFFKQKTAYELRISDWSSDVCSSDLLIEKMAQAQEQRQVQQQKLDEAELIQKQLELSKIDENTALAQERRARVLADIGLARERKIGRASCRDRGCQYV